ncbi:MAG: sulfate reduction electron transfer complex DsrMKJOP subunit DsrJ [Acidobacteria bacterium]|jgi:hypothetical protein|nr:sulfate reduction electron transfer complex DsrMKJOP subunit DsrJ [Acidobacteriota bacterium]
MYDAGKIVAGLAIFVILATSPLWYNALSAAQPDRPELQQPTNGSTECVEATDYMRANHMHLLDQWRDTVVREDVRTYTSEAGKDYTMSLTDTCLDCHSNKEQFCDACHTYSAVDPYCWDCHVIPGGGQ